MRPPRAIPILLLLLLPSAATAQPLAARVPADAVAYFGWKGAESPANGYAGSHLQAVIDASNFTALRDEFLPQALQKSMEKNGDNGDGARGVKLLFDIYWRHPTAFSFSGTTTAPDGTTLPRFVLICQAGDDANTLLTLLNAAIQSGSPKVLTKAFESGNIVALTVGYAENETPLPDDPADVHEGADRPKSLADDGEFVRVCKQVTDDPFVLLYVDTTKAMAQIDKAVEAGTDEQAKTVWPKVRDASGLLGLRHIAISGGFTGRDWATQAFIDAPAPRTGLLSLLEPKPIDPDLLARVPATAGFVKMGQFDAGAVPKQIRTMMVAANPDGGAMFDKGMALVQMMIGRNLKTDILDPLGTQWAAYNDSALGDKPLLNTVIVNKLTNADKAKTGWTMLTYAITNASAGFIRQRNLPITFNQSKAGDLTIYTIQTPFAQPCWTVSKGYMYFGVSPQALAAAASAGPATQPFISNEAYNAMAKKLAVDQIPSGFEFANLPATAQQVYPQLQASIENVNKLLEPQGLKLPENLLPPLDKLTAELTPSARVFWADETGFYVKGLSPFPGSGLFSTRAIYGAAAITDSSLGGSILGNSLNHARQVANSAKSAADMSALGRALLVYAAKNNGKFPNDLATLASQNLVKPDVLINPNGNVELPTGFSTMSPDEQTAWLREHVSYVYGGANLDITTIQDTSAKAVVREKDGEGVDGKLNVLSVDGHVTAQAEADAKAAVGQ